MIQKKFSDVSNTQIRRKVSVIISVGTKDRSKFLLYSLGYRSDNHRKDLRFYMYLWCL